MDTEKSGVGYNFRLAHYNFPRENILHVESNSMISLPAFAARRENVNRQKRAQTQRINVWS